MNLILDLGPGAKQASASLDRAGFYCCQMEDGGYFGEMEPALPDWTLEPVARYLDLLDRWSRTHALTSLEKEQRFEELILDSAALLPFLLPLPAHSRVVDFGTGMGIPAVLIALARPDLDVVALDKSNKKIAFVRQAALELGIGNLAPLAGRAEALPPLGGPGGGGEGGGHPGTARAAGGAGTACRGRPSWPSKGPRGPGRRPPGARCGPTPTGCPAGGSATVVELRVSG